MNKMPVFYLMIRDLVHTAEFALASNKRATLTVFTLTTLQAMGPAIGLYIGKMLLDTVADAVSGRVDSETAVLTAAILLLIQYFTSSILKIMAGFTDNSIQLLGSQLTHFISTRVILMSGRMDYKNFENPETYNEIRNAISEAGSRPIGALGTLIGLFQSTVTLLSVLAMLTQLGIVIVSLILIGSVFSAIQAMKINNTLLRLNIDFTESFRKKAYFSAILTNHLFAKEIRTFDASEFIIGKWNSEQDDYVDRLRHFLRNKGRLQSYATIFSDALSLAAAILVLLKVINERLTIGDFSLLIGGIDRIQSSVRSIFMGITSGIDNLSYIRLVYSFIDKHAIVTKDGEQKLSYIRSIEFDNVSFSYPGQNDNALHNVSFKINSCQFVALVGENGSGKSSIIKLLLGLYKPSAGQIRINDLPLDEIRREDFINCVSVIFQDFGQYHLSISDNIALSDTVDYGRVDFSWKESGLDNVVKRHALSRNTILGKSFSNGVQLSGGEWQRVALSRLYYKNASLYVLDEPTSALDPRSEDVIINSLIKDRRESIKIIVTHRMSSARRADIILVIKNGRLVEAGSHDELLADENEYSFFFNSQARGYR